MFRKLFVGGAFTFLAMQVSFVARAWLAFELTGTNKGLGGVMLAFGISSVVSIPIGGIMADRFPKRIVLMVAAVLQTITPLGLGMAVAADVQAYWMLLVSSLVQGAMLSIMAPARLAFLADMLDGATLPNAVFLSNATMQFTRVLGPLAAGALIGVKSFGLAGVFFLAAGLGVLSMTMVTILPPGKPAAPSGRSPLGDLTDGLRFVRSRRDVLHLLLVSYGVVLIGFPHSAFLPTVAEQLYNAGSQGLGLLTAAASLGAVPVALALANTPRGRLRPYQIRAALVFGATLAVFALMPNFVLALAVFAMVGASSTAFQALNNSLLLTTSPVEYHGRVQSLLMLSFTGFAIAALPIGALADAIGIRPTLTVLGVLVICVAVLGKCLEPRGAAPETAP